jgi:hypothetical protein
MFSGPSPAGPLTTFYCLWFVTPPTWRTRSQYLYPPGTGLPSYTPRHWVPFSSPPTTRRATVEVFEPVSTRGDHNVHDNWDLIFPFYIEACRPVARQQIPNTHQWTNWEEVFSMLSVIQLLDATIEELLEAVFSMLSVPRCCKQNKTRI